MNDSGRRQRGSRRQVGRQTGRQSARQAVEVVLESPRHNMTASLGVHDEVTLAANELRIGLTDHLTARFHDHTRSWHLPTTRAEELGVEAGPWQRICLRTSTGRPVLRIEPEP